MFSGSAKLQTTIFGEFKDIIPTPDRVIKLMQIFQDKGFIPGTFLEIESNSPSPANRISLTTQNSEWLVNIGTQRVDILKNPTNPSGTNLEDINGFIANSIDIINKLLSNFERRGNRCALVAEYYYEDSNTLKYDKLYNSLRKPFGIYTKQIPFEWNIRDACKRTISEGENNEIVNIISMLNRMQGQIIGPGVFKSFDRIQIIIDINSIPERYDQRYDIEKVKWFYSRLDKIHNEIAKDIDGVINA